MACFTASRLLNHGRLPGGSRILPGVVLLAVVVALPAGAQPARKLALADALELAERQNLELRAARERRGVSLAGVQIARQRPNPSATTFAMRDSPHEGLFFDQPLEVGPKRRRRIELARQEVKLTEVEISALARRTRRNARVAFYEIVFARAATQQQAQLAELARRLRQVARERFEAGDVAQLEVIQAELELARAEAELRVAQEEEKVALSRLNAVLNEPAATSWEISGSLEDRTKPVTMEELLERAYRYNPELQHLAQQQVVERSRQAWLRADRIPNLGLEFGTDYNAPHDFRVGPRSQLSLVLPLFSRNQGEIAQSAASQRVLDGEVAATGREVAARVEQAYLEWFSRQTKVRLYGETLLPAARRLEGMAEESYSAGKANILAVVDAQRNFQHAVREYLQSLLALQEAFAMLEETVGAPLD